MGDTLQLGADWPWAEWAEALEGLLLDMRADRFVSGLSNGQRVAVALPEELLFQGQCWLPFGLTPAEVRARLGQDIRRATGFSLTDLAWDGAHLPLMPSPGEPNGLAHAWVAAPKDHTDGLLRLLASAGLAAVALEPLGQSLARFCRAGLHRVVRRDSALLWAYALLSTGGVQFGLVQGRRAIAQTPWWPWTEQAQGLGSARNAGPGGLVSGSLVGLQSAAVSARRALLGPEGQWAALVLVGDVGQASRLMPQLPTLAEALGCRCAWLWPQAGCSGAGSAQGLPPSDAVGLADGRKREAFDSAFAGALSLALWPGGRGLW